MNLRYAIGRRSVVIPLVVLLMIGFSTGITLSQSGSQEPSSSLAVTTAENDYVTCTATSDVIVTCTLAVVANQSSLNLVGDVLPMAQQVNSNISTDTAMWIQAWGGTGGKGDDEVGGWTGGGGGDGGFAQTTTTISDYQTTFGTAQLHYYIAEKGGDSATFYGAGGAAASTIVASAGSGFSASNTLLIAGGGGGGNYAYNFADGQNGGHGGVAIATSASATYGAGQDVKGNGGTARGGSHYGPGLGSPIINPGNADGGGDGFGGYGGGGFALYGWANGDANTSHTGGGVSSNNTGGVPSGGGYGGGGYNACGWSLDTSADVAHHNCAAPGGGSYAAGVSALDAFATGGYAPIGGSGTVRLVFNLRPMTYDFAAPTTNAFDLGFSGIPTSPAFVDIDADGDLDAFIGIEAASSNPLAASLSSQPILAMRNDGTATEPLYQYGASNPYGLQSVANGGNPAFADIDGDGDFDAFIGNGLGLTIYFQNTGSPTKPHFATGTANPFGLSTLGTSANRSQGTAWVAPAFADVDDDGDLDAFLGTDDGHVYYFQNTGSATSPQFASGQAAALGIAPINDTYAKPAFLDVEGDGDLDLFIGGGHGSTGFYQNTGTARNPQFLPSADTSPAAINRFGLTNVGGYAAPTFVDIDGDGTIDAFIGSSSGNLWFYQGTPWSGTTASTTLAGGEPVSEPVPAYATTPDATIAVSDDGTQITATLYGSADFDANQVHRDILSFEDWSGTRLAVALMAFWGTALGDVNGDGFFDRTVIFHGTDPAAIQDEIYHGKEFCLRGVTTNGIEYEACNFADET